MNFTFAVNIAIRPAQSLFAAIERNGAERRAVRLRQTL
jgi:hypothetical protein